LYRFLAKYLSTSISAQNASLQATLEFSFFLLTAYSGLCPTDSMYCGLYPTDSLHCGLRPTDNLYCGLYPTDCLYCGLYPTDSLYCGLCPTDSMYCGLYPTDSLYCGLRPTGNLYCGLYPTHSLYCGLCPTDSLYCGLCPTDSCLHFILRVRIPSGEWMFVSYECCVLSVRGLCVGLITRPEESYRQCGVSECDREASIMWRPWPARGCCAIKRRENQTYCSVTRGDVI